MLQPVAAFAKTLAKKRATAWRARVKACEGLFGPCTGVVPGVASDGQPAIDLCAFTDAKGVTTLVTNGMSDRAMKVQPGDPPRLELLIYVDAVDQDVVDRLALCAAFPFLERTGLGHGDTIAFDLPLVPESALTDVLLLYDVSEARRSLGVKVAKKEVATLWCVPISARELRFKRERGLDALLALFDKHKHPLVLDPRRRSYV